MPPEDAFVDIRHDDGESLRLHYLRWGNAGGRPVVLVHASGFLAWLWRPVAERLAQRYQVLAYDVRGHGDSDKPPALLKNYHWQKLVDDLRAFLDVLGLHRVAFVGHSSGGAAGLFLAAHQPDYFSRIVAIEPIVMPAGMPLETPRANPLAESARRRRMVWKSTAEMIETYRTRPAFARWSDDVLSLYAEHGAFQREDGQLQLKCPGDIEAEVFAQSASLPVWDVLPRVRVPILVAKGERTEGLLDTIAQGVAGQVPDGRLVTVPDAGHLAPMERPAAIADLVLGFLAEAA